MNFGVTIDSILQREQELAQLFMDLAHNLEQKWGPNSRAKNVREAARNVNEGRHGIMHLKNIEDKLRKDIISVKKSEITEEQHAQVVEKWKEISYSATYCKATLHRLGIIF